MLRRSLSLAFATLVIASLAACAPGAQTPNEPAPPKTPTEVCLGGSSYESSSTWIETDDGRFDVGLVGEGDVTAIFVHQLGADACGWFLYAADLAAQGGVRAMLLNLCDSLETECTGGGGLTDTGADAVLASAEWARSNGAQRVVVVGASIGGTTAMFAAIRGAGSGALDAVANLSGPVTDDGTDLRVIASAIDVPALLVVGPADPVVAVSTMTDLGAVMTGSEVTLISDANGHGWDTLNGPGGTPGQTVGEQLAAFIRG
jgi:pimeloyl-ACP methyl ester carboxylesterase